MISYKAVCLNCKQTFDLIEGTQKYREYKRDRKKKFWCDACEGGIVDAARKGFINRHMS
ncbi:hypothetical protein [Kurthia sibirica]|uniref:hypothetical protein n=1 Tax=Kurthia sibirica TaxID=202750 RepID=UPI00116F7834|nr:hypothetical protein [Kurthia sibirica]GEK35249.1 hypothetical protein KSI01_27820 [Kurthia sibirica]